MAKFVLNAGHTLKGKGTGAVGYLNEGIEARAIVEQIKRHLEVHGHNVIVVNISEAESQEDYLQAVVCVANRHRDADAFVSIHLNAGGGQGCEAYTWKGSKHDLAVGVCNKLSKLGFRNRLQADRGASGMRGSRSLRLRRPRSSRPFRVPLCSCLPLQGAPLPGAISLFHFPSYQ